MYKSRTVFTSDRVIELRLSLGAKHLYRRINFCWAGKQILYLPYTWKQELRQTSNSSKEIVKQPIAAPNLFTYIGAARTTMENLGDIEATVFPTEPLALTDRDKASVATEGHSVPRLLYEGR
ncbi:hypothetical protein RRG08_011768 [Elysia crispata]|uniref:Uncharacterized protein n=1 Tax=Elysia crispata TaxID=231223 RepID=A0AAE0ZQK7_9GAST|nr:hypothetical protein RRG08_011768 [Elysia crispata]